LPPQIVMSRSSAEPGVSRQADEWKQRAISLVSLPLARGPSGRLGHPPNCRCELRWRLWTGGA
jgi:hypothetical protein